MVRDLLLTSNNSTDVIHATVHGMSNKAIPMLALVENMGFVVDEKVIWSDAQVAIVSVVRGYSKIMKYLTKTQGVDLGWLSEVIVDLGFEVRKVPTKENIADLFTKAVDRATLVHLLPLLGIMQKSSM